MIQPVHPTPLDYRTPGTPGPGGDLIFRWLCTRHCLGTAGAVLGLVGGLAVVVGGGVLVSATVELLVKRFGSTEAAEMAFWPVLGAYIFLVLPLLFWRTIRSGGEFYADHVLESDLFHGRPKSYGTWSYRGDVAATALYVDLLFWGPRLIVEGVRQLSGNEIVRSASVLRRATFVLSHLLQTSEAVRTKALRIPNEPMDDFQRVLHWMDRHDYIGVSADGQRVWLASQARQTLCLMLNHQPLTGNRRRGRKNSSQKASSFVDQVAKWQGISTGR